MFVRSVRLRFWVLVRGGMSPVEAAACLGVNHNVGKGWFRKAGGVAPAVAPAPASYRRLSIEEREQILAGMERGDSIRAIAARLGRAPSTVQREITANLRHQSYRPAAAPSNGGRRRLPWGYSPHRAQLRAEGRRARSRPARLATNTRLRDVVQSRLELKHSPEQIAARLRVEFPDEPEMWVSHETIYQSIYVQSLGALRRELARHLRTGRSLRRPHHRPEERRGRIPDMTHISQRPAEVADRAVPGHWEGDLIVGANNASAIGTLVERATGFVALLHLPDRHGVDEVTHAMITAIRRLPERLRKTVTWDQGTEMAGHARITLATDVKIYFCDPHSPWQRGSNENTNGLLRQYFPKSTDLSGYHPDYLDYVANQLNDRPRKRLNWQTPKEALNQLLSPHNPPSVAPAG